MRKKNQKMQREANLHLGQCHVTLARTPRNCIRRVLDRRQEWRRQARQSGGIDLEHEPEPAFQNLHAATTGTDGKEPLEYKFPLHGRELTPG